jgi:hypothetical protein
MKYRVTVDLQFDHNNKLIGAWVNDNGTDIHVATRDIPHVLDTLKQKLREHGLQKITA